MKKVLPLVFFVSLLTSCTSTSVKVEIDEKSYQTDQYEITLEVPRIKTDIPYQSQFNSDYLTISDKILNTFSEESLKSDEEKDRLTMKQDIKLNRENILSIVGHIEAFVDDSHPKRFRIVKNIDLEGQRELTFSDLFLDSEFKTRINAFIKTRMQESPDQFLSLWKTPEVTDDQDFYLSPDGVVIFYPPYELSYYSKGFIEIEIPYDELESYLIPEILALK